MTTAKHARPRRPLAGLVVAAIACALAGGAAGAHQAAVERHAAEQAAQRQQAELHVASALAAARSDHGMRSVAQDELSMAALRSAVAERDEARALRDAEVESATALLAAAAGKVPDDLLSQLLAARDEALGSPPLTSELRARHGALAALSGQVQQAVAAWELEQERIAAQRRAAEEAARAAAAQKQQEAAARAPVAAPRPAPAAAPTSTGTIYGVAESTLRSLPNNDGVTITWDRPDIGNSLGGVWIGETTIMLNRKRLSASPGRVADVVRHELAHVYQGRSWQASGLPWTEYRAHLAAVFGGSGYEESADCVALRLGATWVHYTRECSGEAKQAWVTALIAGTTP